jgi:hypothetical protein
VLAAFLCAFADLFAEFALAPAPITAAPIVAAATMLIS